MIPAILLTIAVALGVATVALAKAFPPSPYDPAAGDRRILDIETRMRRFVETPEAGELLAARPQKAKTVGEIVDALAAMPRDAVLLHQDKTGAYYGLIRSEPFAICAGRVVVLPAYRDLEGDR